LDSLHFYFFSVLLGAAYPVYRTFKALESSNGVSLFSSSASKDGALTYWSIFGCLSVAEAASGPLFQWFPWYYHCKLGFLFWLQNQDGAGKLYRGGLKPFLRKHEEEVDKALEFIDSKVNTHVTTIGADVNNVFQFASSASRAVADALSSLFNSR
jgi:receptor expression-enhancing protein 5/6